MTYLNKIGFLSNRIIAAHLVWVTDEEIDILKSIGVGVAHNPQSNMKLASGVAPVPADACEGCCCRSGNGRCRVQQRS